MLKPVYKAINKYYVATPGRESSCFFSSPLAKNSFLLILKNMALPKSLTKAGYFAKKFSGNKWNSNY